MTQAQGGRTALYAFSGQGLALARRIATHMIADIYAPERLVLQTSERFAAQVPERLAGQGARPFSSLHDLVAQTFARYPRHVFLGAAGIAVRAIAPHLRGKDVDPAVVVLDQAARFAVSLLSGHLGGANELARELAAITNATPVITTGTDAAGLPSVDELARLRNMVAGNLPAAKAVSAALLEGRPVQVFDPEARLLGDLCNGDDAGGLLMPTEPGAWNPDAPGVWCHWRTGGAFPQTFRVYPRCLALGLGCRKGVPEKEILAHVAAVFAQADLALQGIAAVGTATIKREDPGLCAAAAALGPDLVFYEPKALASVTAAGQSATVRRRIGTGSVCEAAALLLAQGGELVAAKTKTERVTCAVALMPHQNLGGA